MISRLANPLRQRSTVALTVYALIAVTFSVLAGIVSASGNLNAVATFSGVIVAAGMLLSRNALLWFVVFGALVVVGAAQLYFPEIRHVRYVLPLAGIGLILHGLVDHLNIPRNPTKATGPRILPWASAFVAVALISLLINFTTVGAAVTGIKIYFQMWPFLAGLVFVYWAIDMSRPIAKALLFIAFLQLPFVLHQYFYLVPIRSSIGIAASKLPVDIVAGTFGADLIKGGANAALAAFLIIVIACLAGIWKRGVLTTKATASMSLLFMVPLLLNQAKVSALYLLAAYAVLFYQEIARKPIRFIVASSAALGLFALLMTAMTLTHPREEISSWTDLIEYTIERQQTSVEEREGHYSELTRWTALTFWASEHLRANPIYTFLGHGPGASRVQDKGLDLAQTLAEEEYGGMHLGFTAASSILWDTGLLGMAMIIGIFISAFRAAGWLSRFYEDSDPFRAGLYDGLRAGFIVLLLSLAHKDFFVYHIPYQTLTMLLLGVVVIAMQQISHSDPQRLDR